jgi:putative ABC transport system permease protein
MVNGVDPSFFDVMGMRIVEGRGFSDADNRPGAPKVTVVNEAMAKTYWKDTSPIGRCILLMGKECTQVIGVVGKASPWAVLRRADWNDAPHGQYFVPIETFKELNGERVLLVRTAGDPHAILARLRSEAQIAAADLPYVDASPLDEVLEFELAPLRLGWSIFLALSGIAIVIAVAGLAVVTAHGVTRRTREMGIRLVLGATPADLVRLMARRTIVAMGLGLVAGAAIAFGGARLLRNLLFGVEPGDPRVFVSALVALFVIGSVAAYIPARRTGRIDPSAALRIE